MRRVAYLALQSTQEGQAGHTHVHEVVSGLRKLGWRVDLYDVKYRSNTPGIASRAWQFVWTQWRLWRDGRPDILYIRGHVFALPSALIARSRRVPVVTEVNGHYEDYFAIWPGLRRIAGAVTFFSNLLLRLSSIVIAVTPSMRKWVRSQGIPNVYVVPNGANVTLFRPGQPWQVESDRPPCYVAFVGALSPWQGIERILAATRHSDWPQGVSLAIAGDGKDRPVVEREAQANPRVVYLGRLRYQSVAGVLANALASLVLYDETGNRHIAAPSPLKLYESLACGTPVLVSSMPGIRNLVRHLKCGLIVDPRDPGEIARAVAQIAHYSPETRMAIGERGRRYVTEKASWQRRVAQIDKLLRILNNEPGKR